MQLYFSPAHESLAVHKWITADVDESVAAFYIYILDRAAAEAILHRHNRAFINWGWTSSTNDTSIKLSRTADTKLLLNKQIWMKQTAETELVFFFYC